jgi:hypothetical protein
MNTDHDDGPNPTLDSTVHACARCREAIEKLLFEVPLAGAEGAVEGVLDVPASPVSSMEGDALAVHLGECGECADLLALHAELIAWEDAQPAPGESEEADLRRRVRSLLERELPSAGASDGSFLSPRSPQRLPGPRRGASPVIWRLASLPRGILMAASVLLLVTAFVVGRLSSPSSFAEGSFAEGHVVGNIDGSSMGGNVRMLNVTRRDGAGTGDALVIKTMGGRIDVDDAPGGAKLETMGGNVSVGRAANYVDAKTMGGDIVVGEIAGWIEASTMGGDIEVQVIQGDHDDYHVELVSMGGEIDLSLPAGLGYSFDVELEVTRNRSGQYEIKTDFPLEIREEERSSRGRGDGPRSVIIGTGRVGDGAHVVKIRTINGNVNLRKK